MQVSSEVGAAQAAASLFLVSAVGGGGPGLWSPPVSGSDYDPTKRDPSDAGAGPAWEATAMRFHYHPSVRAFAASALEGDVIDYRGDPLKDFALAPFLDRFAFRNPKSRDRLKKEFRRGESVAERRSSGRGLEKAAEPAVNDPAFLAREAGANEEFFFRVRACKEQKTRAGS